MFEIEIDRSFLNWIFVDVGFISLENHLCLFKYHLIMGHIALYLILIRPATEYLRRWDSGLWGPQSPNKKERKRKKKKREQNIDESYVFSN